MLSKTFFDFQIKCQHQHWVNLIFSCSVLRRRVAVHFWEIFSLKAEIKMGFYLIFILPKKLISLCIPSSPAPFIKRLVSFYQHLPISHTLQPMVTTILVSSNYEFNFFFFLASSYQWDHALSVFVWLISLGISPSSFIRVKGRISYVLMDE